jgi:predicted secreted acid phosphatase
MNISNTQHTHNLYLDIVSTQIELIRKSIPILITLKSKELNKHHKPPVAIIDIDETVISNVLKERTSNNISVFNNVLTLIDDISNSMDIIFLTGRRNYMVEQTQKDLLPLKTIILQKKRQFQLIVVSDSYIGTIEQFKANVRKDIADKNHIIMTIGDQINDMTKGNTGQPFLIFNPYYTVN